MDVSYTYHGGRLSDALSCFGGDRSDWLDLSTGINPHAWTPPLPLLIDWQSLPDPAALTELEYTAANYFGASPPLCLAVPGSEAGLRALGEVLQLPGRHLPLCYSTHIQGFAQQDNPDGPTVRVIGNPNNPDGTLLTKTDLLEMLESQEASGGWLLVDEAFVDCSPEQSMAAEVCDDRHLIVTRSFGKFFGLAGVRLGFVLAPSFLLARLRKLQGEWPICAAGLSFGAAAYADATWISQTRARLLHAAQKLDFALRRHDLAPHGNCPLFRLVEVTDAHNLFKALAHKHILTRPFADHPQLLRFGLPANSAALARLEQALVEVRQYG